MHHLVSLSGGVSSAVAADRVISRYGRSNVTLWFADTLWEDEDLYRFLDDCLSRWGGELITFTDGHTPLQVAEQQKIIPNNFLAPCTFRLKIEPFTAFLKKHSKPVTVHLGLNWDEQHRMAAPKANYEAIEDVTLDFPLLWQPLCWDTRQEVRSWGIPIPHLYELGFPHNNCGGRCVKQGIGEWNRLRIHFPERFAEVRDWELSRRALGGKLANRSIASRTVGDVKGPITLQKIELENSPLDGETTQGDMFVCFCSY
ncbi:MAG: hypothetical protein DDT21_01858 [Syntrophomonadaceae bacterium]|nr:hypothetical protein [Bacillota bacterium]